MTDKQTAALLKLISKQITDGLKHAIDELPPECAKVSTNALGQAIRVYPALFDIINARDNLVDLAEKLESQ